MLFWLAVEQEAPHPSSIHDPPLIQGHACMHSFKSTTPPECFIVWLVTSLVVTLYQVLSLSVWSLPITVWSLPWQSPIANTGNYQQKTTMKLGKKLHRFRKENLEYILSDHFRIRLINMKIHLQPNTVLTSLQIKSVSTYLSLMNQPLCSQTSMKMYV